MLRTFARTSFPLWRSFSQELSPFPKLLPARRVAITGAAGQVAYSILYRIARGDLLSKNQPVILQLIDQPGMEGALKGVKMELEDCSFPLLERIETSTNLSEGFKDAEYAFLIGARPRGPGMERKDLLLANAQIFAQCGNAINDTANPDIKVLVVGNPCNTNCLICATIARKIPKQNFAALTKLDHNRAKFQLADKVGCQIRDISQICIWGNHSPTMYPDLRNTLIKSRSAFAMLERDWIPNTFIPTVQTRGGDIIKARKLSSAASAGNAALEHMREWIRGSQDWTSFAIMTEKGNEYRIPEGIVFSFPVTVEKEKITIVPDIAFPDKFSRDMVAKTTEELLQEREAVKSILTQNRSI